MKIDNEFKNVLPPLTDLQYRKLEEGILERGVTEPLVVWEEEDILVDGHNRYEIAKKHNIDFKTEYLSFPSRDAVKAWIIRTQIGRRNLTSFQQSEYALRLKPVIAQQAKERKNETVGRPEMAKKSAPIETRTELAKIAGVSHDTIHKVDYVLNKGSEETKELARSGKISTNEAYKRTVKENEPPKPDILSVKEEHEAFKAAPVVSMDDIEIDKGNQRIIALDMSLKLLKAAEAFEKLTLTTTLTEIKEDTTALNADEKEHLITQMRSVRNCADGIIKALGGL